MVTAQFLAETGDGISLVALPLYVYARTNSELLTSLTFAAEMAFGAVAAVLGGVFADAFDRQKVLLRSYLFRTTLLVLAFLIDPLLIAVTFGVIARASGQGDNPSFDALVPSQAEDDLQQVLAIRRIIQGVSYTVGPAVGALTVALVGPRPALVVNAATFIVAFAFMVSVPGLDTEHDARRAERHGIPVATAFRDLLRGLSQIIDRPGLRRWVGYQSIVMATVGLVMAAAVVWFERDLEVGGYWFGLSVAGYGIGTVLGLAWAGSRTFRWPLPRILLVAAPFYAVACGVSAAFEEPWLLPLGWALWGIALGPEMVVGEMFFVGATPPEGRGRAYAALGIATTIGMAVGYAIAGPLLEAFDARWVILGTSGVVLLTGLVWLRPALRGSAAWSVDVPVAVDGPATSA